MKGRFEMVVYKNSTKDITIEQCLQCQAVGLDVIITDGEDVTFELEITDYNN